MTGLGGTDRDDVKVKGVDSGGTDREITAVQDGSKWRIATDCKNTYTSGDIHSIGNNLRYDDMNASTGGIARATSVSVDTWTRVYNYTSGSGYLFGFLINLESNVNWYVRLVVDSVEVFGSSGLFSTDLTSDIIYDLDFLKDQRDEGLGVFWSGSSDKFVFNGPGRHPMRFSSSIAIWVKRVTSAKLFRAGVVSLIKE